MSEIALWIVYMFNDSPKRFDGILIDLLELFVHGIVTGIADYLIPAMDLYNA